MPSKISFRVVHVSGQDENFKAVELNNHSPVTKGWQSSRFCLYPQDIVVQLDKRMRLRKIQILSHQFLIATKIEFYVGDVPEGTPVSLQNARYTRLGYVALSGNEKTGFKARELKSVHVDAIGVFVKFVIHKNHINKHNLYNQVGIVAMNVIGDDVYSTDTGYPHPRIADKNLDPALAGLFNRPDFFSPLDDLAFDMYQDPEVAQIIRKLEKKKQEAVLQERYDYAKKLKNAIQDLQKVGEKLGKYEVEKRQAVENEDYDKAKLKKIQMDEYRLQVYQQLEIHDLLELTGPRYQHPVDLEPIRQPTPPRLTEIPSPPHRTVTPPDERPLPAIKNKAVEEPKGDRSLTPHDDKPLPVNKDKEKGLYQDPDDELPDDTTGNVTGEPEAMSEKDQREAASVIDTYGLPLVCKAYSKTWSFREDALLDVLGQLREASPDTPKEELRNMMRSAIFLVNKGLRDKVLAVFTAAIALLRSILTEFVPNHRISKQDTAYAVEKTLPTLLQRTGDTAVRIREAARDFAFEESKFGEVQPLHVVPHECVKPFKLSIAPRLALSRTELVDSLYKQHGLTDSGLTLENMMKFCTQALQHNAGEVREKSEKIIIALYKQVREPVKEHLPPDTEKTRKNVLYKQLFEAFDKIDGKPSKDEQKKKKLEAEQAKQKEIEALQNQLQQLKDMAAGKARLKSARRPSLNKPPDDGKKDAAKDKKKSKKPEKSGKPAGTDNKNADDASEFQIDRTCIFCGEKNDAFTEEGLDVHYWKECPMLKRCSFCKQVVEIAGLTDHLLTECDSKDTFQKCPRCSEAVPKAEFEQHIADKSDQHNPSESGKNHCPLCHQNLTGGEDGWKQHLMGKDGCKQNPRRLNKHNKGKSPGKNPPPKSQGQTKAGQGRTPRR